MQALASARSRDEFMQNMKSSLLWSPSVRPDIKYYLTNYDFRFILAPIEKCVT